MVPEDEAEQNKHKLPALAIQGHGVNLKNSKDFVLEGHGLQIPKAKK
jgi:hypothetical protein